jgi:hypothetical protein
MSTTDTMELSKGMHALVKKLGHVEKESRDKAVQKLKIFLASRRSQTTTELEFLKLWKGLFYCMWMSDKTPVQQELAVEMAQLVHTLNDASLVALWLRTFHFTMRREWHMIDKYRLDKYYSLMRYVEHETFVFLRKSKYTDESVEAVTDHIDLHFSGHENSKRQGTGVALHFVEVFLNEIYKAVGTSITTEQFELVFLPVLHGYSRTTSMERALLKRTETAVFDALGEEFWFRDCNGTKSRRNEPEEEDTEVDENTLKIFPKVKLAKITARIWNAASHPEAIQSRRKVLYALHKRLKRLLKLHGTHYAVTVAPLIGEDTEEQKSKTLDMLEKEDNTKASKKKSERINHQQAKVAFELEANNKGSEITFDGMDIGGESDDNDNEEADLNDSTATEALNDSLNDSVNTEQMNLSEEDGEDEGEGDSDSDSDSDSDDDTDGGDGWESDTIRGDHGPMLPPGWNEIEAEEDDDDKNNKKRGNVTAAKKRVRISLERNEFKAYNNSIRDLKKRKLKSASELPSTSPRGGILKAESDRRHSVENGLSGIKERAKSYQESSLQYNFTSNGYGGHNTQKNGGRKLNNKKKKRGRKGGRR